MCGKSYASGLVFALGTKDYIYIEHPFRCGCEISDVWEASALHKNMAELLPFRASVLVACEGLVHFE
jgi:hypothetical protein